MDLEALKREADEIAGIKSEPVDKKAVKRGEPKHVVHEEHVHKDNNTPDLTFHKFQQRITELTTHKDVITPALMLSAAAGRIAMNTARVKENGKLTGVQTEELVRDMGQCFYYLSSISDHVPVSLQRIAEIMLGSAESAAIKRLQK